MPCQKRLIFGCGYLGRRVADRWLAEGHEVFAVTRSAERAKVLARASITPIVGDLCGENEFEKLPAFDAVLFAVGYDRTASHSLHEVYVGGLLGVLHALTANRPHRMVYISSTGVYGATCGQWICEQSPCEPTREGGKACLAAENLLTASALADCSLILRLAGIYGPGRLPRKADLLAGLALQASESGYLNLIHVDDAVSAINLALERAVPPRTYLVSDGSPVVRGDYYREVAAQFGAPAPQFDESATNPRVDRSGSDKRICNARIVKELGFAPRYPSYREGIAASIEAG